MVMCNVLPYQVIAPLIFSILRFAKWR